MEKEIVSRNVEMTPEWRERIELESERLSEHHPGLIHHLRCAITATKHQRLGLFELSLVAAVPNDTVVVKQSGELVANLLVDAFAALDRQLKEYASRRQQMVKQHSMRPVGTVAELVPMQDYGRISADDGSLVYFHRNAVKDVNFEELHEGDFVEYGEEMGDLGPQATWVRRR